MAEKTTVEPPVEVAKEEGLQVVIEGSSLVLIEDGEHTPLMVYFDVDSDVIDPEVYPVLDALTAFVQEHDDQLRIEVQGHADERGSDVYNDELSLRRAKAVKQYLVERGVEAARLVTKGFGEKHPLATEDRESYRRNRRVEFVLGPDSTQLSDATTASVR